MRFECRYFTQGQESLQVLLVNYAFFIFIFLMNSKKKNYAFFYYLLLHACIYFFKRKKNIHSEKNKNILIFFFYNQIYEYMLDVSRITLIKINNKKTSTGLNFNTFIIIVYFVKGLLLLYATKKTKKV